MVRALPMQMADIFTHTWVGLGWMGWFGLDGSPCVHGSD